MQSLLDTALLRVKVTARLARLGANRRHRLKLALSRTWYLLQRRAGFPPWPPVTCRIRDGGCTFDMKVSSVHDLRVLEEIFVERTYDISYRASPAVIVDLGANIGASAAWFKARFPAAHIFALEPSRSAFGLLDANCRPLRDTHVFHEGIGAQAGTASLHISPRAASASLLPRDGSTHTEQITLVTLDGFLQRERLDTVDLLKFDVEGAELDVFRTTKSLHRVRELIGEYHEDLTGVPLSDFLALFPGFEADVRPAQPGRFLVHLYKNDKHQFSARS